MEDKTLFELVNEVEDEESFLLFVETLYKDRMKYKKQKSNDEWNNETIEGFLERAYSWGKDSKDGLKYYEKPNNPWKRCAQILYMGKIYE